MNTVAVFGGAFDPVTTAHKAVVDILEGIDQIDEVWVIPCFTHPWGKNMVSYQARLDMCRKVFNGKSKVVEFDPNEVPSEKTFDFLLWLSKRFIGKTLLPVIGSDEASQIHKWHRWDELVDNYKFIVFQRFQDSELTPVELKYWSKTHAYLNPCPSIPLISSSKVRKAFNDWWSKSDAGERKGFEEFEGMIEQSVFNYIVTSGLYKLKQVD